jgi:iron-sulfur cluster repair protein YtfE (RIC family)
MLASGAVRRWPGGPRPDSTAEHLERIADLTDDYAVPVDARPNYRSMLTRLDVLEAYSSGHPSTNWR